MWARISASRHDRPRGQSSDHRRRQGQRAVEGCYPSGHTDIAGKISPRIAEGGSDELGRTGPTDRAGSRRRTHIFRPQQQMVRLVHLWAGHSHAARHRRNEAPRGAVGSPQGCPKARRHPAPDVGRWHRPTLRQRGPGLTRRVPTEQHQFALEDKAARSCGDDGRGDLAQNPDSSDGNRKVVDSSRRLALPIPSSGASPRLERASTAQKSE